MAHAQKLPRIFEQHNGILSRTSNNAANFTAALIRDLTLTKQTSQIQDHEE